MIVMVSILTNKDVFEPSYNDLKFTVKYHNYICTNLVFSKLGSIDEHTYLEKIISSAQAFLVTQW